MPPSNIIAWICSDCSFKNEDREHGPCLMCHVPHPKRKAVVASPTPDVVPVVASAPPAKSAHKCWPTHSTHPSGLILDIFRIAASDRWRHCVVASPTPAVVPVVTSAPPAKSAHKCWPTHSTHPSGLVLDIFRIATSDRWRHCEEHKVCCCGKVLKEEIVVRLRKERILTPNYFAGKGKTREKTAITVNWVTDGINPCHVGFLPSLSGDGGVYKERPFQRDS